MLPTTDESIKLLKRFINAFIDEFLSLIGYKLPMENKLMIGKYIVDDMCHMYGITCLPISKDGAPPSLKVELRNIDTDPDVRGTRLTFETPDEVLRDTGVIEFNMYEP